MSLPLSTINIGTTANDGTGDTVRAAFYTVNNNFSTVNTAVSSLQTNVVTAATIVSLTMTGDLIANNVTANTNITASGNVAFNGGQVTHYDSIIDLHTYGNLAAWTSDDGKDIGLRLHYYNGADRLAFIGLENTSKTLQFLINATEVSGNVTGTFGNAQMGSLLLSNSTASTSNVTGALVVTGGVGVGGNVTVAGNLVLQNGVVSNYFLANVVTGQVLTANLNYRKFVANTNPGTTIANLWINLPTSAVDGQELHITSLAPLTSCYVYSANGPVLWLSNTFFSSGNVSTTVSYNASNSKWMKF